MVSCHPILDQIEGLDQWVWNRFLEVRAEKVSSEEKLAKQRGLLEELARALTPKPCALNPNLYVISPKP